jgi:hypothetical protein
VPPVAARTAELRSLATFEIVDQAASFWRRRIATVVTLTLVATLPVQLLSMLACRSGSACVGLQPGPLSASTLGQGEDVAVALVLAVLAGLAAQLAAAAIAHVVTAERLGNPLAAGAALRLAGRRYPAIAVAWLLGHLLLVLSGCTVVGPLVVMTLFLVATPAIAIEGLGPVAGLRRAWRLGRRRFWPLLGVGLASGLVASLLGLAFSALPLALAIGPLTRFEWALRPLAQQLQVLVAVPLTATAAALAYLDVRVRSEGLDLQLDAELAFPSTGARRAVAH